MSLVEEQIRPIAINWGITLRNVMPSPVYAPAFPSENGREGGTGYENRQHPWRWLNWGSRWTVSFRSPWRWTKTGGALNAGTCRYPNTDGFSTSPLARHDASERGLGEDRDTAGRSDRRDADEDGGFKSRKAEVEEELEGADARVVSSNTFPSKNAIDALQGRAGNHGAESSAGCAAAGAGARLLNTFQRCRQRQN